MSKHREFAHRAIAQRAITQIDKRQSGGSLGDDPITIGIDKTINIDLSKLPAPPNVYDADFAWVEHKPGAVSLLFAKRNRDDVNQLRTRLEVRYPPENLVQHFWANSRKFHPALAEFAAKWPVDASRESIDPSKLKAVKEHSEWANFESMAHAGTEGSLDFYRMPPSGIAQFAQGRGTSGLTFAPVVRIQLTIFELVRLLNGVGEAVKQIESYLPRRERKEDEVKERERVEA